MNEIIDIEIIKNDLLKNISDKYKINYDSLLLDLDNLRQLRTVKSKYNCDHYFFSREEEKSFYWAGFLAADGCCFQKSNYSKQICLSLSNKDRDHLNKFVNDVKFDGKIHSSISRHSKTNPKWHDSTKCGIAISSTQLFDDLKKFNIVPVKTHIFNMTDWLKNHELVNHFIRGYFDGDGCIWYHKEGKSPKAEITFRGTMELLTQIKDLFQDKIQLNSKVAPYLSNGIGLIKYSGNRICTEIRDYLYKDSTIYMDRKYKLCEEIKCLRVKYSNRI